MLFTTCQCDFIIGNHVGITFKQKKCARSFNINHTGHFFADISKKLMLNISRTTYRIGFQFCRIAEGNETQGVNYSFWLNMYLLSY